MQGALDWHPAPKPVLQAAIAAREKAAAHGVDIGTLAIKEAARPQDIAVTLVGMRTPEEVRWVPIRPACDGCTVRASRSASHASHTAEIQDCRGGSPARSPGALHVHTRIDCLPAPDARCPQLRWCGERL